MKKFFENIWQSARRLNRDNILSFIVPNSKWFLLDCGCGNGNFTLELARKLNSKNICAVELSEKLIKISRNKGIRVVKGDLAKKNPI